MRILGLDEAGRGSVLGPLVVGGFLLEVDPAAPLRQLACQQVLRDAGADDSKAMRPALRQTVRQRLDGLGRGLVRAITAKRIDGDNLNRLEEAAFVDLILQTSPDQVYLDAPTHPRGIPALQARLEAALHAAGQPVPGWVIEPKADSTWPVVGAASIYAKTDRDAAMAALADDHGVPLGSGYPSDPVSRRWIAGYLSRGEPLPACVRTRWGTIDKLRQQVLFA